MIPRNDIVTTSYRLHNARQIVESITEPANTVYYMFQGSHVPYANSTIDLIYNSEKQTQTDVYQNMIQGKRVTSDDIALMIRKVAYVSNVKYAMYDDQDKYLQEKDFYVSVDAGDFVHVFKCLDNNHNSVSTIEPSYTVAISAANYRYKEADGYVWQYMYSITSTENIKFTTDTLMPVNVNPDVSASATHGTIDIIKIDEVGRGYNNYLTGTFSSTDVVVNGDQTLYAISNNTSSSIDGFYVNSLLYLTGGTGAGQYRTIVEYFSTIFGRYVRVNEPFSILPTNGTQYSINPTVLVTGTGMTINAVGRALVNSVSSNSVYAIEMLSYGADYVTSSAEVLAANVVDVIVPAVVRPIINPAGGHGFDPPKELGATQLCISTKFSNNEGNTILTANKFQQIGLLKDPKFNDVQFTISSQQGIYLSGETFYTIKPKRFQTGASVNTTSSMVSCADGDFLNQLSASDEVYLKDVANTSYHMYSTVNNVINSSAFMLASNALFLSSNTTLHYAGVKSSGVINNVINASAFAADLVSGVMANGDLLIGGSSGTTGLVSEISRNSKVKSFNTFVQLYKYTGSYSSGVFVADEVLTQTTDNMINGTGRFHSGNSTVIYVSDLKGSFDITIGANTITGAMSQATFGLTDVDYPELHPGSGDILYINNIEPVTRSANTSEIMRVILKF